jgi:hypothetical protein
VLLESLETAFIEGVENDQTIAIFKGFKRGEGWQAGNWRARLRFVLS